MYRLGQLLLAELLLVAGIVVIVGVKTDRLGQCSHHSLKTNYYE